MPRPRYTPCPDPDCPLLRDRTTGDCPAGHRKAKQQAQRRAADRNRPSAAARGYGAAWRRTAKAFLTAHPTCIDCGTKATIPDHHPHTRAELIRRGDPNPDAWHHLQPRCHPCHSRKTARHDGGYGNPTTQPPA